MEELLGRLKKDRKELIEKLSKLGAFVESDKFEEIDVNQSRLITAQIFAMSTYLEILEKRIEFMNYDLIK